MSDGRRSAGARRRRPQEPRKRVWPRRARRLSLYALALVTATVAGLLVTFFTVDVGPVLKAQAENQATKYLERPMHIGRVVARLRPGEFEFHDVVIEGLTPDATPFLKAKKITVALPWWTAFNRRLIVESIDMSEWEVVLESFPGGRHNLPKLMPRSSGEKKKRDFSTTLRRVVASRGHIRYIDHSTPWSLDAPNAHVTYFRRDARADYGGTLTFDDGTIRIMTYEPFKAAMKSRFSMNGPLMHFDRIDLLSEGANSVLEGDIQFNKWPEQTYQIKSKLDIAKQKEIFFKRDRFTATGQADFDGTFHYFKGGREVKGTWRTPVTHVKIGANTWRFPNLQGKVLWLPDRLEVTDATSGLVRRDGAFRLHAPVARPQVRPEARNLGRELPRRPARPADRLSRDPWDACGRSGNWTQPLRMAARRMGSSTRRRRVDRPAAAWCGGHDARASP